MKKYSFLLLLFFSVSLFAQKSNSVVSGIVTDKESGEPLQNATLQLYSLPDSVFKAGTASDTEGKFSFSVSDSKYYLRVSFVGYLTLEKSVSLQKGKSLDLGNIALSTDAVALKAAVVTSEVPPVTAVEDTLVYNTTAFRVPEGSMLEELIKKYPGVEIEDGTIKINGKTVNRILMKGKDFFGTDKDMALKNISVDAVDKVKFYDKKSDFSRITGIDDGEEETVLDLQMKKGVTDGLFSNTDLGYGTKDRYTAKNTTGYYNDNAQYTLVMSANNVGDQSLSGRGFRGGSGLIAPKQAGFNFAHDSEKLGQTWHIETILLPPAMVNFVIGLTRADSSSIRCSRAATTSSDGSATLPSPPQPTASSAATVIRCDPTRFRSATYSSVFASSRNISLNRATLADNSSTVP